MEKSRKNEKLLNKKKKVWFGLSEVITEAPSETSSLMPLLTVIPDGTLYIFYAHWFCQMRWKKSSTSVDPFKYSCEQSQELDAQAHSQHPPSPPPPHLKWLHYFYVIGHCHRRSLEDVLMKVDRREMIEWGFTLLNKIAEGWADGLSSCYRSIAITAAASN